jgi:hypothetical protein
MLVSGLFTEAEKDRARLILLRIENARNMEIPVEFQVQLSGYLAVVIIVQQRMYWQKDEFWVKLARHSGSI